MSQNGVEINGHSKNGMADDPKKAKLEPRSELEHFDALFSQLVDDLTKSDLNNIEIADAANWFKRVCEYNVPFGKKNRGMMVCQSLQLIKGSDVTEEQLKLARILGWCIEWLQAYFLVSDDVMDHSITRRGQPCWYKVKGVGLEAINDALYIENAIFVLLKKYFKQQPCYVDLIELFHETSIQTITGQALDMITAPQGQVDFTHFSLDRYRAIVKYKTAFYSFYLPVACAMHMAEIKDEAAFKNAKTILLNMGEFFQIQDDFLDCFGDPVITGKIGTDIEDNKCGWLCVQALARATPEQRKIMEDHYARPEAEHVAAVRALYDELNLRQVYYDYEESSYQQLMKLIDQLSGKLPKEIFVTFANKIYKRNK